MSNITVGSGQISSGTVFAGQSLTVLGGGSAVDVMISSGGLAEVSSGGTETATVLAGSALEYISAGGSAVGTVVLSGGTEILSSGGFAMATLVSVGGAQHILNGGVASSAILTLSGAQDVYSGGKSLSANIQNGGNETVLASGFASGTLISAGGNESVSSGGLDSGAVVAFSGVQDIYSGGVAISANIQSGGEQIVLASGYASDTLVSAGGVQEIFSGGLASSAVIALSGVQDIYSGGIAISTNIQDGGTEFVYSGGYASDTLVSSGGVQEVLGSGVASSGVIAMSGTQDVYSGGVAISTNIQDGGEELVYSGGVTSLTLISAGGSEIVYSGGVANASLLTVSGDLDVMSGGSAVSDTVLSGGVETVFDGGITFGTTINTSGTLALNSGAIVSGAINFAGTEGTLLISARTMPTATVSGFAASDIIDLKGLHFEPGRTSATLSGDTLTVTNGVHVETVTLIGIPEGTVFETRSDSSSGHGIIVEEAPCFCRGTRILTPRGEVAVEALEIGDLVTTVSGEARPVAWIGKGRSLVTSVNPAARPVIVRRDAIEDGVPSRDLYITRAHALYLDGVLIPVEHLVNGHSILWDDAARVVEFYHVELPSHDVLIADGAPTESYKEEGNHLSFLNADRPTDIAPSDWYAPVLSSGPIVAAAWRRLLDRSGFTPPLLTQDPDLHLLADGVRIDPDILEGEMYRFRLDRAPFDLRIVSRAASPRSIGSGFDLRRLGVAIHALTLNGPELTMRLPFSSPLLTNGFHYPEPEGAHRWTTGNAVVPTHAMIAFQGAFELTLHVVGAMVYPAPAARAADADALPSGTGNHPLKLKKSNGRRSRASE
jgi:autotransporter passenger strand-loop-strand repeat protein